MSAGPSCSFPSMCGISSSNFDCTIKDDVKFTYYEVNAVQDIGVSNDCVGVCIADDTGMTDDCVG